MSIPGLSSTRQSAFLPAETRRFQHCFFVALALLANSTSTHAETSRVSPAEGIIGEDNRGQVDATDKAWSAIGHINIQGYRISERCTGTRIAPRLVLTAAHCVIDWHRKAAQRPKNVHFIAGVDKDKDKGRAVAECILFPNNLDTNVDSRMNADLRKRSVPVEFLRHDLAMIVLKADTARAGVIPAARQHMPEGQSVIHAGYHRDRRQKLLADRSCSIGETNGDLVSTDCDAVAGSSGGPLLVEEGRALKLVAVMVAIGNNGTLAVSLTAWPDMPASPACP